MNVHVDDLSDEGEGAWLRVTISSLGLLCLIMLFIELQRLPAWMECVGQTMQAQRPEEIQMQIVFDDCREQVVERGDQ
jgi:hypothetical protein